MILLTGFEPFGGQKQNPSLEIAKRLEGKIIDGTKVFSLELPCVFHESLKVLNTVISSIKPKLILCLGQAGGRANISIERVAINIDDAPIADNKGAQPIDRVIIPNAPAAYFSTLPIKAILSALHAKNIPASISQTAGTFVCNHVMFGLLHNLDPVIRGGFIHVPYLPSQVIGSSAPSMSLEMMVEAIHIALVCSLENGKKYKADRYHKG